MTAAPAESAGAPPVPAAAGVPGLEWSFNPWRERPGLALLAVVLALGACALVVSLGESLVLSLALAAAAAAALSPLFVPTACRVDGAGVARRGALGWNRRPWEAVRRVRLEAAGLLVSPFAHRSWLDPYRALFLPLPAAGREALRAQLEPIVRDHDAGR